MLKIGIILSTTRANRFADRPTQWLTNIAKSRGGAEYTTLDLRDYPLPFFDEAGSPIYVTPTNEVAARLGAEIAKYDGFIIVAAEYNHGIPGVLKNALDHLYPQFNRKPVAFVGYGPVGAARGIEQLRLVLIEMQAAPLRNAVHIGLAEYLGLVQQGKDFADFPYLEQTAGVMLDDLLWWASALRTARQATLAAA